MSRGAVLDVQPASRSRKIAVIGSGYVGLAVGASLALLGHEVECTDESAERVAELAAGRVPIVEEGLTEVVQQMLAAGRLRFASDNALAAGRAEFVFLCLPTPKGADGWADLSFVWTVAAEIGPRLRPGATVITKSTVPVGTGEMVERALARSDVHVASNPEFLAEGRALRDCLQPDRIVIGARSDTVARDVADLYGSSGHSRVILTDVASAELIKYACNAYLAIRLTFVNSMAEICEAAGADIRSVVAGLGSDHRIGDAFLQPGPGWGGSCFPKDTHALARIAERLGCDLALVETAITMNAHHTQRVVDKVAAVLGGDVSGRRIALWGLTFKAGTDDLRDSPALEIAQQLAALGASVHAYDPTVPAAAGTLPGIEVHPSSFSACKDADALVIGTEWPEFASADLTALAEVMGGRVIMDARNVLDPVAAGRAGFAYAGIGIPVPGPQDAEAAA
jgi:UDPglucose 6-dehydrogenase